MGLTFGQYIQRVREKAGLQQEQVGDFGQPYISDIENGRVYPARKKTIQKLAKALSIPDNQVTWLWVYSLLKEEPRAFFIRYGLHEGKTLEKAGQLVKEDSVPYAPGNNNTFRILEGDTPADIRAKLGPPDRNLHFKNKRKYVYRDLGVQVLFENDQVVDVVFK